ncbi:MAG: 4Fe-4S binding protein [Anaerolineales bacterium]|nr:4Fe-4S binding protein [Anaerolineales bacterium]
MHAQKIAVVCFSGTGVTRSYAEVVRGKLMRRGFGAELIDVTAFSSRAAAFPSRAYGGYIFGAPVYADFPPRPLHDWLSALAGGGRPCAVFVTYGGRTPGYAQYHLYALLTRAGFRVRLCAEFLGRHTFNLAGWNLMADRPNEADFAAAREFAVRVIERFDPSDSAVFSLQKPCGYDTGVEQWLNAPPPAQRRWGQPMRFRDCSLCGACEAECPVQAMDMLSGESDPAKCIECLHCLAVCPENALKTDERLGEFFPSFLKEWGLTEEILARKRSRIIAHGWQAPA